MNSRPTSLLVLGLGNVLLADDGVGPAAIAWLQERVLPPAGVVVVDGGTLGLSLLSYVEETETLLLIDAVMTGAAPGTLVRLEGDAVGPAVATRLSPHQIGVADLLEGATWRGKRPARILLLGIVPESIDLGVGLTPAVARSMPALIELIVGEARALGHVFAPALRPPASGTPEIARLALGGAR